MLTLDYYQLFEYHLIFQRFNVSRDNIKLLFLKLKFNIINDYINKVRTYFVHLDELSVNVNYYNYY